MVEHRLPILMVEHRLPMPFPQAKLLASRVSMLESELHTPRFENTDQVHSRVVTGSVESCVSLMLWCCSCDATGALQSCIPVVHDCCSTSITRPPRGCKWMVQNCVYAYSGLGQVAHDSQFQWETQLQRIITTVHQQYQHMTTPDSVYHSGSAAAPRGPA